MYGKSKLRADITTVVQKHNELQTFVCCSIDMHKNFLLFLRSQGIFTILTQKIEIL